MNSWKAILAAIVIFGAGAMTGGLLVNHADQSSTLDNPPHEPGNPPMPPGLDRSKQLIHLLDTKLSTKLTPDQKSKIEKIISDGQSQISGFWKTNGEPMRDKVRQVNQQVDQQIREQLTPDQQKQFEDLSKHPLHHPNSTNAPSTNRPALATNAPAKSSSPASSQTPDR